MRYDSVLSSVSERPIPRRRDLIRKNWMLPAAVRPFQFAVDGDYPAVAEGF
jgi:hypothetical protein